MKREIVVTAIIKYKEEYLIVKRNDDDSKFPGAWEFPGGHIENNELLLDGLKRELYEEIGIIIDMDPKIVNYSDEFDSNDIYNLEIDFLIEVDKKDLNIHLSEEHSDYKWVSKDSNLLDDYIKSKIK